ncbi:MAG: hypothetical protein AB1442_02320 [Nitrospirota bacterium]
MDIGGYYAHITARKTFQLPRQAEVLKERASLDMPVLPGRIFVVESSFPADFRFLLIIFFLLTIECRIIHPAFL